MSLGWLTESSLIPKEPKPIQGVGRASLIGLQAAVFDREQRGPALTAKRRRKLAEAVRNDGIEARQAKDERESAAGEVTLELSSAKLREKAQRYEAMVAGKEAANQDLLVDFAGKQGELTESGELPEVAAMLAAEEDQDEKVPASVPRIAIPPPACLATGTIITGSCGAALGSNDAAAARRELGSAVSSSQLPPTISGPAPSGQVSPTTPEPASTMSGAVKQMFERPLTSSEDRAHAERLTQHTELCRETVGPERRQARAAVRERLAALRAGKQLPPTAGIATPRRDVLEVLS